MMNFVKISIAQIDYNERGAKTIFIKASEISEIIEASILNFRNYHGGYTDNYQCIIVMTNGNAYKAIESIEEIMSQLSNEG